MTATKFRLPLRLLPLLGTVLLTIAAALVGSATPANAAVYLPASADAASRKHSSGVVTP